MVNYDEFRVELKIYNRKVFDKFIVYIMHSIVFVYWLIN